MAITALDTHEVVKELRGAGFADEQAEAVARVIRRSQDIDLSDLVTTADLRLGLAVAKGHRQIGLAETRSEILQWTVGTIGVQTIVMPGVVAALSRFVLN